MGREDDAGADIAGDLASQRDDLRQVAAMISPLQVKAGHARSSFFSAGEAATRQTSSWCKDFTPSVSKLETRQHPSGHSRIFAIDWKHESNLCCAK